MLFSTRLARELTSYDQSDNTGHAQSLVSSVTSDYTERVANKVDRSSTLFASEQNWFSQLFAIYKNYKLLIFYSVKMVILKFNIWLWYRNESNCSKFENSNRTFFELKPRTLFKLEPFFKLKLLLKCLSNSRTLWPILIILTYMWWTFSRSVLGNARTKFYDSLSLTPLSHKLKQWHIYYFFIKCYKLLYKYLNTN